MSDLPLTVGQRVEFVGCLQGWLYGLPPSVLGSVKSKTELGYYLVDWDDYDEASKEEWCRGCLKPIQDPEPLTINKLAEDIGWRMPAKETT